MQEIQEESFGVVPVSLQDQKWHVFIILHRAGSHWGFPKGRSSAGETPLQAASRELKEETGLEVVKLLRKEPITEIYQFRRRGKLITKRVHYFFAQVAGKEFIQLEEIRDGKWIEVEKAEELVTFKEAKAICHELINLLKTV
jgi:8-oxo-dGTP pyrophosphatase MutT (NUDIX family)